MDIDMTVSFSAQIKPLFRDSDVSTMLRVRKFDLSKYEDVKRKADDIFRRLSDGDMPCDGPWPQDQVDLFKQWIDTGKNP